MATGWSLGVVQCVMIQSGSPVKLSPGQSLRTRGLKKAASSVAAFFLIAVVFTAFCKRLRSRVNGAGVPHRRLAEGGGEEGDDDEELEAIIEACLDYQEEHGFLFPSTDVPPETAGSSLAAIQAGLLVAPHGPDSTGALWPFYASQWPVPTPPSPHDVLPAQSVQPLPSLSGEGLGTPIPQAEGDTSVDGSVSAAARLEPLAWLDQIPNIISADLGAPLVSPVAQVSLEDDTQPSTSLAAQAELPPATAESDSLLKRHPYVHVPKVQPGAVRRTLKAFGYCPSSSLRANRSYEILKAMHDLLVKSELNEEDAENLMKALEKLLVFVRAKIKPVASGQSFATIVERFGMYLLIFDSAICACEALGPATRVSQWWQQFVNHFKLEYPLDETEATFWPQKIFSQKLALRLQQALQIYRTGIRPSANEVIHLKRMLFSSGRTRFSEPRWDPWRKDDQVYQSEYASSRQSENEDGDDGNT
ncbi:hypothetical protein ACSSS7_006371 [Eimeria intestinalis]